MEHLRKMSQIELSCPVTKMSCVRSGKELEPMKHTVGNQMRLWKECETCGSQAKRSHRVWRGSRETRLLQIAVSSSQDKEPNARSGVPWTFMIVVKCNNSVANRPIHFRCLEDYRIFWDRVKSHFKYRFTENEYECKCHVCDRRWF